MCKKEKERKPAGDASTCPRILCSEKIPPLDGRLVLWILCHCPLNRTSLSWSLFNTDTSWEIVWAPVPFSYSRESNIVFPGSMWCAWKMWCFSECTVTVCFNAVSCFLIACFCVLCYQTQNYKEFVCSSKRTEAKNQEGEDRWGPAPAENDIPFMLAITQPLKKMMYASCEILTLNPKAASRFRGCILRRRGLQKERLRRSDQVLLNGTVSSLWRLALVA